jgi:hypothetical protein
MTAGLYERGDINKDLSGLQHTTFNEFRCAPRKDVHTEQNISGTNLRHRMVGILDGKCERGVHGHVQFVAHALSLGGLSFPRQTTVSCLTHVSICICQRCSDMLL